MIIKGKGKAGYIRERRKRMAAFAFSILAVGILFIVIGYLISHKVLTVLSGVGLLIVIFAIKKLYDWARFLSYQTLTEGQEEELMRKSGHITMVFDCIFVNKKKRMQVDAIAISGKIICGYTQSEKVNLEAASVSLGKLLEKRGFEGLTVKIFHDYLGFLARVEGMENIATVAKDEDREQEEWIRDVLIRRSL